MVFLSGAYQAFTIAGLPPHLNQDEIQYYTQTKILDKSI